jgi:hypothetical protein
LLGEISLDACRTPGDLVGVPELDRIAQIKNSYRQIGASERARVVLKKHKFNQADFDE